MIGQRHKSEYVKLALGILFVIQRHALTCAKLNPQGLSPYS